ncbi:hypothetical protein EV426DRAFT_622432 [Tirmania nivea]|nr:hypothetical protein EV426DRAFT_622432 [Tirmania nivea]
MKERPREHRERGGDTDDEMFDEWSRENEFEIFHTMGKEEWKTLAMFLLEHVVTLVEGVGLEEAPPGTGYSYARTILGKDGSVAFKGRDELSEKIILITRERERLQSEVDDMEVKMVKLRRELSLKSKSLGDCFEEVRKLRGTIMEFEGIVEAAAIDNGSLWKQLQGAEVKRKEMEREAESKWKLWAKREVQRKRKEMEKGAEEGLNNKWEQQMEKDTS